MISHSNNIVDVFFCEIEPRAVIIVVINVSLYNP